MDKTSQYQGSNYYCFCHVCAGDVLTDSSLLPGPVQRDAKYNVLSLIKGNHLVKKTEAPDLSDAGGVPEGVLI